MTSQSAKGRRYRLPSAKLSIINMGLLMLHCNWNVKVASRPIYIVILLKIATLISHAYSYRPDLLPSAYLRPDHLCRTDGARLHPARPPGDRPDIAGRPPIGASGVHRRCDGGACAAAHARQQGSDHARHAFRGLETRPSGRCDQP